MRSAISAHSALLAMLFSAATALCQTKLLQQPYCGSLSQTQRLFIDDSLDPQDVGKSLIIGQVKAIENTKLTISRLDGVEQFVIVDANTELFSDYGCSAALADFRIGERVYAIGTIENDDFVTTKLLKAPAGPTPSTPGPCDCASGFRTQATSASNLLLNGVGTQKDLRQLWENSSDAGYGLPLNGQKPQ